MEFIAREVLGPMPTKAQELVVDWRQACRELANAVDRRDISKVVELLASLICVDTMNETFLMKSDSAVGGTEFGEGESRGGAAESPPLDQSDLAHGGDDAFALGG